MNRLLVIIVTILVALSATAQDVLPTTAHPLHKNNSVPVNTDLDGSSSAKNILTGGSGVWVDSLVAHLDTIVKMKGDKGHTMLGCAIYDLTDDRMLYTYNGRELFKPASTQKLFTAITALDILGYDYKFSSRLYMNGEIKEDTLGHKYLDGDICISGSYDPLFTSDRVNTFADCIHSLGIDSIGGKIMATGFEHTLSGVLSPMVKDLKKYDIKFSSSTPTEDTSRFLADISKMKLLTSVDTPLNSIFNHMMKHSTNEYAESLLHNLSDAHTRDWSYERCKDAVRDMIKRSEGKQGDFTIYDGSGLSHSNKCTPEVQVAILRYAYHKKDVFRRLYESLPIAGVDGTMGKRLKDGNAYKNVHAKTGTISGVSTLAGYVDATNGHRLAFSILLNNISSTSYARSVQNDICEEMAQ